MISSNFGVLYCVLFGSRIWNEENYNKLTGVTIMAHSSHVDDYDMDDIGVSHETIYFSSRSRLCMFLS